MTVPGASIASADVTTSTDALESHLIQVLTIQDLISYAYKSNPAIAAARAAWQAKVESHRVATGLPDPQFMITYFPEPLETRLGPQEWNATLSQNLPFPGKLIKAGEVVKTEVHIAKLQVDKTVRDVVVSIREAAYELIYIREAQKITAQNADLLEQLRTIGETAYAEDRTALVDIAKALSQIGQLRYDKIVLDELELAEIARLNGLLNRPPQAVIGQLVAPPLPPLSYRPEALDQLAASHQEEIRIAEQGISRADAQIGLAQFQRYPDFKVGLFYAAIGDPDVPQDPPNAGNDAFGVQFGVTLPLWFGKNQGRLNQARAERARAEAIRQSRINESRTQIHAAYFRLRNARRLVELYQQELLPQAVRSLELAETGFRAGQSSFSDVLEAQSVYYNFQLALARAQADYGKRYARLEGLVGRSLAQPHGGQGR
jgi:outer membrane protein TolC